MLILGITGGVGTGKSTVARMFGELGATVLDADRLAHEAMAPGRVAWRRIVHAFGRGILRGDRTIDRAKLAAVVFRDASARRRLERIVHPQVYRRIARELSRLRRAGAKAAVVDVPLLLETHAQDTVDAVVVVTAPKAVRSRRLRAKGWTTEEIERRHAAQWDTSAKVELADYVVENGNGLARTRRQVRAIWRNQLRQAKRIRRGSISRR